MNRNSKSGPGSDFAEVAGWWPALSRARLGPLDGEVAVALSIVLLAVMVLSHAARSEWPRRTPARGAPVLAGLSAPPLIGPQVPFDGAWYDSQRDGFTIIVPRDLDAAMVIPVDPNLDAAMVVHRDGNGRAVPAWPKNGPPLVMPPGWAAPPGQPRAPMPGPWRIRPPMIKPR